MSYNSREVKHLLRIVLCEESPNNLIHILGPGGGT